MKIAIDVSALLPQLTGVDNYLIQLVLHLGKIDQRNEYLIIHNYEDRRLFADRLPNNFTLAPLSLRPRPFRLLSQQIFLPIAASCWEADVVHSPSFIMPYLRGSARHALTVHDMTFFSHPQCHIALRRSRWYRRMVLESLRRTDVVLVPSQATRQAVLQFLPEMRSERIHVIAPGINEEFQPGKPATVQNVAARLALPEPYILYVGTLEPRKNLPVLVESFRRLAEAGVIKEHLVLAGKLGWGYEALLKQVRAPALRGKVHLVGYVNQADLPAVYAGARVFVYPSLYEGFGFPPLEAMACGVPVISTRSSSLIENLEGAAELVPPDDVTALVHALRRLLTDDTYRVERKRQGLERVRCYQWEQTAKETLRSYQAVMNLKGRRGSA